MSPENIRNRVFDGLTEATCRTASLYLQQNFQEELEASFAETVQDRSGKYNDDHECVVLSVVDFIDIVLNLFCHRQRDQ